MCHYIRFLPTVLIHPIPPHPEKTCSFNSLQNTPFGIMDKVEPVCLYTSTISRTDCDPSPVLHRVLLLEFLGAVQKPLLYTPSSIPTYSTDLYDVYSSIPVHKSIWRTRETLHANRTSCVRSSKWVRVVAVMHQTGDWLPTSLLISSQRWVHVMRPCRSVD